MDLETIRRISLARHLYELGMAGLRSSNDIHLFASVNLLQDAVEAFLIAVGEFVGAGISKDTKFDKYFIAIDEKIAPKELPFKLKIIRLNNIRVGSKHYGIQPDRGECDRLAVSVREFFDEVANSILGVNFATISAIDLLEDGEVKDLLLEAKAALESGDKATCVVACRKVIYLEVERHYDIAGFLEPGAEEAGLLGPHSFAPFYARNKDYIEKNVREPTDYIVLDHSRVGQDLLSQGVDTTEFWNIWRLTPSVYRAADKTWIVKNEFTKLEQQAVDERAEYLFNATVDFALTVQADRRKSRVGTYGKYHVKLKRDGVPVYQKADNQSKVVRTTPHALTQIDTDYWVLGLRGDARYWYVTHIDLDRQKILDFFLGYIHEDDISS